MSIFKEIPQGYQDPASTGRYGNWIYPSFWERFKAVCWNMLMFFLLVLILIAVPIALIAWLWLAGYIIPAIIVTGVVGFIGLAMFITWVEDNL